MIRTLSALVIVCLTVSATACTAPIRQDRSGTPERRTASATTAEQQYDHLYPVYAEFCAASQIKKLPGRGATVSGGPAGHGVLYLKGACHDESAPYPKLKICDDGGVGVSVNSDFSNVNWVALPSKTFLLFGDVAPGTRINGEVYDRVEARVKELNLYRGIEFHSALFSPKNKKKPADMPNFEYVLQDSFGTDFALNFGRNLFCARLPITAEMMKNVVSALNQENEKYYLTKGEYQWAIGDNCTDTTHNALAAVSVWESRVLNHSIGATLTDLKDLTLPANDFVNLLRRGNNADLSDVVSMFRDKHVRKSLDTYGWIPMQHGVLAELFPIMQPNDLYNTDLHMTMFDIPVIHRKRHQASTVEHDPRYLEIAANLEWFISRYEQALRDIPPADHILKAKHHPHLHKRISKAEFKEFFAFHAKYVNWLNFQLNDARQKYEEIRQ